MLGEWVETTLNDLIEIKHGFAFKGEYFHDEPNGDILLTPGNFSIGGGFKDEKYKYYDGPVHNDFVLSKGDLLVTMTDLSKNADTLGCPAFVPDAPHSRRFLHNQRLGKIVLKKKETIHLPFLHYLMCSREYHHEIVSSATGTTVKHTSPDRIKRFRFQCPPLKEQHAIAHILGTLDDKIELNRRMNKTLEELARAIFKSWFVDFDPVRAKAAGQTPPGLTPEIAALFPASFEDSELGKIPRGWKVLPLSDAMEVNPPRPLRKGEVAPYLDMANMPTQGPAPDIVINRPFNSGMRFINGDTLVARITPCLENGKTAFVDFLNKGQVGWGSTEYIVLHPKPPLPDEYAYCLARSDDFREFAIQSMTGSSGRQRVPAEALSHYHVVLPSKQIAGTFGKIVDPLFARIKMVTCESRALSALRDTLLPKLISGELRVTDAERIAGRGL